MRMLIIGYVFAIRSERQLCGEVQVNLAYRWFCRITSIGRRSIYLFRVRLGNGECWRQCPVLGATRTLFYRLGRSVVSQIRSSEGPELLVLPLHNRFRICYVRKR
jgi:hypothetical protein